MPPENQIPSNPEPIAPKKSYRNLIWSVLLVLVLALGLGGGYVLGKGNAPEPVVTQAPDPDITLPEGATVIAECIEGLGKQYVMPEDIPYGPIYNVHDGKVGSIEYMFNVSEMTKNPERFMNLEAFDSKYDHINIDRLPEGHAGNKEAHFHVDLFRISDSESDMIKCGTQHQDATH